MSLAKLSKETFNFYAPRFSVEIKSKKEKKEFANEIIDISVTDEIENGVSFSLTMHDAFDMKTQTFKWLDHEIFKVGNKITIKMGYENNLSTMVVGKITSIEPSFFTGETPTFRVNGYDLAYDYLKRVKPQKIFRNKTHSEIVQIIVDDIAKKTKLKSKIDATEVNFPSLTKDNETTYFAFLEKLAKESHHTFYIDADTLYFIKSKEKKKEVISLALGRDLISFNPILNTAKQVTEVEVRGHNSQDPSNPIIGYARAGDERVQELGNQTASQLARKLYGEVKKVITNKIVTSKEHATKIAHAELNKCSDNFITGHGECIGIPQIISGTTILIEKIGVIFSGKYYVKKTVHTIGNSGYKTSFDLKRNAMKDEKESS